MNNLQKKMIKKKTLKNMLFVRPFFCMYNVKNHNFFDCFFMTVFYGAPCLHLRRGKDVIRVVVL